MGVGLYTVHVAYAVVTPGQDTYNGTATVVPGLTPAPSGNGLSPRFQNHYPQQSLITAGKGLDAGEPSIGADWKTGKVMYISDLTTFRVTFDDSCPANAQKSTWEDKSAPNNQESLDPILFTDHGSNRTTPQTARTFASQLTGQDSLTSFRSEEHTSELQSPCNIVCRLLLEKQIAIGWPPAPHWRPPPLRPLAHPRVRLAGFRPHEQSPPRPLNGQSSLRPCNSHTPPPPPVA